MGTIDNQGNYHEDPSNRPRSFWESLGGAGLIDLGSNFLGSFVSALSNPYKNAYKYWERAKDSNIADVNANLKPSTPYYNMASNNMQGYSELLGNLIKDKLAFMTGETMAPPAAPVKAYSRGEAKPIEASYPWMNNVRRG